VCFNQLGVRIPFIAISPFSKPHYVSHVIGDHTSMLALIEKRVRHAPNGLPAGTMARRRRLPGPTLSFHLNVLAATGLVRAQKNGRSISYSANLELVNRLTDFLMENCCGGRGGCGPIAKKMPSRR
jgi:ArsR family transcriptional regulator